MFSSLLGFFVPHENFSLIYGLHNYHTHFDQCSALMAIEQWKFFSGRVTFDHTSCCWALGSGTVTTCFYNLGLPHSTRTLSPTAPPSWLDVYTNQHRRWVKMTPPPPFKWYRERGEKPCTGHIWHVSLYILWWPSRIYMVQELSLNDFKDTLNVEGTGMIQGHLPDMQVNTTYHGNLEYLYGLWVRISIFWRYSSNCIMKVLKKVPTPPVWSTYPKIWLVVMITLSRIYIYGKWLGV